MEYFSLYLEFIKIQTLSKFQYRVAFIGHLVCQAASYIVEFLMIWIMINGFKTIGNWSPYEVMFLFSINLLTYALAGFFLYSPCNQLGQMIKTGEFDDVMVKPLNPFVYLISSRFNPGYIGHSIISISAIILCISKLGISITFTKIFFLIITIISGALIQGAAFIFSAVPSFWLVESSGLSRFFGNARDFIRYPISVYSKGIQIILTLILPYAFISFYPGQYFLNKDDFLMFHPVLQYLSPIVALILFTTAYRFWIEGIKNYKSTGS